MRFIELPVFPDPRSSETKPVLYEPEEQFFLAVSEVPTKLVEAGAERKPITRPGTFIGKLGGGGLLVDLEIGEMLELLVKKEGQKEAGDGNGKSKSPKKNKGRVRKSTSNGKGRQADN